MLIVFPAPLPDELLYSTLARYHVWSANINIKHTIVDLFGSSSVTATLDLPGNLQALCDVIGSGSKITPDKLIENHTLFPIYRPFLPIERAEKIYQAMISNSQIRSNDIHYSIGLMASKIPIVKTLRFCPKCVHEDAKVYGEPYWHRIHQIFGVYVCPSHQTVLMEVNDLHIDQHKHQFIPLEECFTENGILTVNDNKHFDKFLRIATYFKQLLEGTFPSIGLNEIRDKYIFHSYKLGYVHASGRVRQRNLVEEFTAFYGDEFLNLLASNIQKDGQDQWIQRLLRKQRNSLHPLFHILFMGFLKVNPKTFLGEKKQHINPFGKEPWPCLNAVCKNYRKLVIRNCQINRNTGKSAKENPIVGTFTCGCGFSYSRSGPDPTKENQYKYGRIKDFGATWFAKLRELRNNSTISLRQKARLLGVDPGTFKHQLVKLSNEEFIEPSIKPIHKNIYRRRVKDYIRFGSAVIFKTIKKICENNKECLPEHFPIKKINKVKNTKVNWEKRDVSLAEKVNQAATKMINTPGKPYRLTISSIGKRLKCLRLIQTQIDRLPLTNNQLAKCVESDYEFWTRKIKYACQTLNERGQALKPWILVRVAGIKDTKDPKIMDIIECAIQEMSFRM